MAHRFIRVFTLAATLIAPFAAPAQTPDVTVFAAASLKNALDDIAVAFQKETGRRTAISYGASSALARQIEQGAPADLFLSALPTDARPHQAGEPAQPGRQPNRAGGSRKRGAGSRVEARGTRGGAWGRAARDRERGRRAGGQIRKGGARTSRPLGRGRGASCRGRERPGRTHLRGARRSASRHRLRQRRARGAQGQGG